MGLLSVGLGKEFAFIKVQQNHGRVFCFDCPVDSGFSVAIVAVKNQGGTEARFQAGGWWHGCGMMALKM
jgi:hypothetical protein